MMMSLIIVIMTWFSLSYFSAGMGIGLVFWGVAEPLNHLYAPPFGEMVQLRKVRVLHLRFSFFHWGYTSVGIICICSAVYCLLYF